MGEIMKRVLMIAGDFSEDTMKKFHIRPGNTNNRIIMQIRG
jgi:hypothetical protein